MFFEQIGKNGKRFKEVSGFQELCGALLNTSRFCHTHRLPVLIGQVPDVLAMFRRYPNGPAHE
jgi:hypothetical protein